MSGGKTRITQRVIVDGQKVVISQSDGDQTFKRTIHRNPQREGKSEGPEPTPSLSDLEARIKQEIKDASGDVLQVAGIDTAGKPTQVIQSVSGVSGDVIQVSGSTSMQEIQELLKGGRGVETQKGESSNPIRRLIIAIKHLLSI